MGVERFLCLGDDRVADAATSDAHDRGERMGESLQELLLFRGEHSHAGIVMAITVQSEASMKRLLIIAFAIAFALLIATAAGAQSFEIGPRISNYSTHLDTELLSLR